MTGKTPAEIQIEFLKKLKKEQGKIPGSRRIAPFKPSPGHSLLVSKANWTRLKESHAKAGLKLTQNQRKKLGDWAVELLLAFPQLESLNLETKSDLLKRMGEWVKARGL